MPENTSQQSSDEAYQTSLAEQRDRLAALAAACAVDEHQLVLQLRDLGVRATSVWDLIAEGGAPPRAVPLLVSHLVSTHHERIWEGIVRALSVLHARPLALPVLIDQYRAEGNAHRRGILAHAIGSMATLDEVQDLPDIETYRALFRG
jgi:hypothetical protein